jgi:hypothetical protein
MTLIIEVPDQNEAALKARAHAQGISAEQYAAEVINRDLERTAAMSEGDDEQPVWEYIADVMKDVPPEDMARLPEDGATHVDHYVYGVPKRP